MAFHYLIKWAMAPEPRESYGALVKQYVYSGLAGRGLADWLVFYNLFS